MASEPTELQRHLAQRVSNKRLSDNISRWMKKHSSTDTFINDNFVETIFAALKDHDPNNALTIDCQVLFYILKKFERWAEKIKNHNETPAEKTQETYGVTLVEQAEFFVNAIKTNFITTLWYYPTLDNFANATKTLRDNVGDPRYRIDVNRALYASFDKIQESFINSICQNRHIQTMYVTLYLTKVQDCIFQIIKEHPSFTKLVIHWPLLAIDLKISEDEDNDVEKAGEDATLFVMDADTLKIVEKTAESLTKILTPLADAIEKNKSLTHLDLSTIDLSFVDDQMFKRLFEAVANQQKIIKVSLGDHKITQERLQIIEAAIAPAIQALTENTHQILDVTKLAMTDSPRHHALKPSLATLSAAAMPPSPTHRRKTTPPPKLFSLAGQLLLPTKREIPTGLGDSKVSQSEVMTDYDEALPPKNQNNQNIKQASRRFSCC